MTDSTLKTARIPVKFVNGKFINQITKAEITVEATNFFDCDLLELLMNESDIDFLPAETALYVSVNPEYAPENLQPYAIRLTNLRLGTKEKLAQIKLIDPLYLRLRGTKSPALPDCLCHIPSLS